MKYTQPQKGVRNFIQAPTQMIYESIILNERSKSQNITYGVAALTWNVQNRTKKHKTESLPIAQDWGVGEDREAVKSDC